MAQSLPPPQRYGTLFFYGGKRIRGIHHDLDHLTERVAKAWSSITLPAKLQLTITAGQRSAEDQVRLLRAGKSWIFFSKHLALPKAFAVDFGILEVKPANPVGLSNDDVALNSSYDPGAWRRLVKIIGDVAVAITAMDARVNFRRGSKWKPPDDPHVELAKSYTPSEELYEQLLVALAEQTDGEEYVRLKAKLVLEYKKRTS